MLVVRLIFVLFYSNLFLFYWEKPWRFIGLYGDPMGITLLKHLFEIKRFYAYVKQIQYFGKSNGNTFSFIPHVCYFSYHLSIAASEAWNLATLFATKMRGRKHSHKNINIPVFQICSRNNKTLLFYVILKVGFTRVWFHCMFRSMVEYFKVQNSSSSLRNILLRRNWMPAFIKAALK